MRRVGMYAFVAAALLISSCELGSSNPPPPPPPSGKVTLIFTPIVPQASNLTLTQASLHIEDMALFGDVTPDFRTMLHESSFNVLGDAWNHVFDQAPQGLYSRVRFRVEGIHFQGTYGSYELQVQIGTERTIDLRDPIGREVGVGYNPVFSVKFDGTTWFGDLLAQAVPTGNQILIDQLNNVTIGQAIANNIAASISLTTAEGPN